MIPFILQDVLVLIIVSLSYFLLFAYFINLFFSVICFESVHFIAFFFINFWSDFLGHAQFLKLLDCEHLHTLINYVRVKFSEGLTILILIKLKLLQESLEQLATTFIFIFYEVWNFIIFEVNMYLIDLKFSQVR